MKQGLDLTLRQELRINAQLLQTMETLSLSADELREKIKKEAETNPTLIVHEKAASYDRFAKEYTRRADRPESLGDSDGDDEHSNWIEGMIGEKESLQQHLLGELGCMDLDENVRRTAETLITALDRNGFFPAEPESLVKPSEAEYVPEAVNVIQRMEPEGVGARDWRESLMLQAEARGMKGDELRIFRGVVYDELDSIRLGRIESSAKALRTDTGEIEALFAFLKTLTPFPGRKYGSEYDEYIIPELSIRKEDGVLRMRMNRDALPSVEIDQAYRDLAEEYKASRTEDGKKAEKFIKEKLGAAQNLLNQLEMRATTLERTGAVLMEKQKDFFLKGPLYLKGLTMQEVAAEVGVHEATISRIAAAKYIDTDFGIYPIRALFSSTVSSDDGSGYSRNAVKEMIRGIIAGNTSGKPLSDQKISDILAERGIKAARRTVSKYRHELDIDSSFSRTK